MKVLRFILAILFLAITSFVIERAYAGNALVLEFNVTEPNGEIAFRVDWMKGIRVVMTGAVNFDEKSFTGKWHYKNLPVGIYQISIAPYDHYELSTFVLTEGLPYLTKVKDWGVDNPKIRWTYIEKAFKGCINLESVAGDKPVSPRFRDARCFQMFMGCKKLKGDGLQYWSAENIDWLSAMFARCEALDFDISAWGKFAAESLNAMFSGCKAFRGIGLNEVKIDPKVKRLDYMFWGCAALNAPLDKWDVSHVTHMIALFRGCKAFNQPLNTWNVTKVVSMDSMFKYCEAFDQPLDQWKVEKVVYMNAMFRGCKKFNQSLATWNTKSLEEMVSFLQDCESFNSPVEGMNVANVREMSSVFRGCKRFNQPINQWKVGTARNMSHMFEDCTDFNQPLDQWDTRSLYNGVDLFKNATSFDQSLANWKIENSFTLTLGSSAMSLENYYESLAGWKKTHLPWGFELQAPNIPYDENGRLMRYLIQSAHNWEIKGDVDRECYLAFNKRLTKQELKEAKIPKLEYALGATAFPILASNIDPDDELTLEVADPAILALPNGETTYKVKRKDLQTPPTLPITGKAEGKAKLTISVPARKGQHLPLKASAQVTVSKNVVMPDPPSPNPNPNPNPTPNPTPTPNPPSPSNKTYKVELLQSEGCKLYAYQPYGKVGEEIYICVTRKLEYRLLSLEVRLKEAPYTKIQFTKKERNGGDYNYYFKFPAADLVAEARVERIVSNITSECIAGRFVLPEKYAVGEKLSFHLEPDKKEYVLKANSLVCWELFTNQYKQQFKHKLDLNPEGPTSFSLTMPSFPVHCTAEFEMNTLRVATMQSPNGRVEVFVSHALPETLVWVLLVPESPLFRIKMNSLRYFNTKNPRESKAIDVYNDIVYGRYILSYFKMPQYDITVTADFESEYAFPNVINPPTPALEAPLAEVIVAPNPFAHDFRILNPALEVFRYQLFLPTGQVLRTGECTSSEEHVATADLPAGLYLLRLVTLDGTVRTFRVLRN